MGSFQDPAIIDYLLKSLTVDSVGLNEDELARAMRLDEGWEGSVEGAWSLRENLQLGRVGVHTRDYQVSVIGDLIAPEREIWALSRGAEAAAALAATGSTAGCPPEEFSPQGIKARDEFCQKGAVPCGDGAYRIAEGIAVCLVPARLARSPKITVGLGDTTTAVTFFEELQSMQ
jgi:ADP-dependent phosphofructokinase/glucokinase